MKRLYRRFIGILLCLLVISVVGYPLSAEAQTWSIDRVRQFVSDSLPRVEGSVVSVDSQNIYVDLEQGGIVNSTPVQISRTIVTVNGEPQYRERVIGSGTLHQQEGDLVRLAVPEDVASRIRVGDRVRPGGFDLYVVDQTNAWNSSWSGSLSNLSGIKSVQTGRPVGDVGSMALLLSLDNEQISLKKVGEWGALATQQKSAPTSREKTSPPSASDPYLERVDQVSRILNDFDLVPLPQYPRIKLVILGGQNEIGFARWKQGKVKSLSWHSIPGDVLSVIPLADRMDGLDSFPFLLVKLEENQISTIYYEFDLTERRMRRQWSAENTWMEAVGQRLYAWQLGLNEPFKDFGYRVEVKDNSWDWIDSEKKLIPPLSVPSAVAISNSSIFRLNKDGNLDVFRDGQKSHSSSEVFGGHPVSIKARRSQTTTDRHPSMLSWKTSTGQTRLVVGNNQTKGIPYFKGLQSYDESRLYLLLNQSDYLDTLWESERLSGYIAGVFPGPGGPWVISVLPSNEETVIKKLKNVDYHFDK